jgi:acyl-CoA thioesterase-1
VSDTVTNSPLGGVVKVARLFPAVTDSMRYAILARYFKGLAAFALLFGGVFFQSGGAMAAEPIRILALGDSLTSGYGLDIDDGFPSQLQKKLIAMGYAVRVLNGGVSGDTSAGGLARLDWALADKPTHAIIELGANDGLRGLDPSAMHSNLDTIIRRLKGAGVAVLLTGMRAPPNLGRSYETAFNKVFPELAKKHDVVFYPFFLSGVVVRPALNLQDGMHPNRDGIAAIVDRIVPYVVRLLKKRTQG